MTRGERSLELGEDPSFQRRSWRVQMIGWMVMVCVLLAGMLGLLGSAGPLVSASSGDATSGITVDYARFLRSRSPIDLELTVMPEVTTSSEMVIEIDRTYLEWFDIQSITPQPSEVHAGDSMLRFVFKLTEPGQETSVTINLQPEHYGYTEGWIRIEGMPQVELWQLIYP